MVWSFQTTLNCLVKRLAVSRRELSHNDKQKDQNMQDHNVYEVTVELSRILAFPL